MRQVVSDIVDMARDKQIGDKQFRHAIASLSEPEYREKGVIAALRELRIEAIYETERELYVH